MIETPGSLIESPESCFRPNHLPRAGRPLLDLVGEVVRLAVGTDCASRHLALSAGILARAPGDRQHRIAAIQERSLDGDLPFLEIDRPEALIRLPRHGAEADTLIGADLDLV